MLCCQTFFRSFRGASLRETRKSGNESSPLTTVRSRQQPMRKSSSEISTQINLQQIRPSWAFKRIPNNTECIFHLDSARLEPTPLKIHEQLERIVPPVEVLLRFQPTLQFLLLKKSPRSKSRTLRTTPLGTIAWFVYLWNLQVMTRNSSIVFFTSSEVNKFRCLGINATETKFAISCISFQGIDRLASMTPTQALFTPLLVSRRRYNPFSAWRPVAVPLGTISWD
jgi:hypothetical protein